MSIFPALLSLNEIFSDDDFHKFFSVSQQASEGLEIISPGYSVTIDLMAAEVPKSNPVWKPKTFHTRIRLLKRLGSHGISFESLTNEMTWPMFHINLEWACDTANTQVVRDLIRLSSLTQVSLFQGIKAVIDNYSESPRQKEILDSFCDISAGLISKDSPMMHDWNANKEVCSIGQDELVRMFAITLMKYRSTRM